MPLARWFWRGGINVGSWNRSLLFTRLIVPCLAGILQGQNLDLLNTYITVKDRYVKGVLVWLWSGYITYCGLAAHI